MAALDARNGPCAARCRPHHLRTMFKSTIHQTDRLLLLVGQALLPGPDLVSEMLRAGVRCLWLGTVAQALEAAAHLRFDAAVVHLAEPVGPGARHFENWRVTWRCPLLVVTDKPDDIDEIIALELGADAYLALPLAPRRLRAHVLALTRTRPLAFTAAPDSAELPPLHVAGWTLDRLHKRLWRADRSVELTDMLTCLLQSFIEELGRVVPREKLIAGLQTGGALQARSIDRYVTRLRQRLHDACIDELRIKGVRGTGYALLVAGRHAVELGAALPA